MCSPLRKIYIDSATTAPVYIVWIVRQGDMAKLFFRFRSLQTYIRSGALRKLPIRQDHKPVRGSSAPTRAIPRPAFFGEGLSTIPRPYRLGNAILGDGPRDDVVVLLGRERAGRVDEAAAAPQHDQRRGKEGPLPHCEAPDPRRGPGGQSGPCGTRGARRPAAWPRTWRSLEHGASRRIASKADSRERHIAAASRRETSTRDRSSGVRCRSRTARRRLQRSAGSSFGRGGLSPRAATRGPGSCRRARRRRRARGLRREYRGRRQRRSRPSPCNRVRGLRQRGKPPSRAPPRERPRESGPALRRASGNRSRKARPPPSSVFSPSSQSISCARISRLT